MTENSTDKHQEFIRDFKRIAAIYVCDPSAKIRHWWGRIFPDVEYSFHRVRDFLIAECGLSSLEVDDMDLRDAAELLEQRAKIDKPSPAGSVESGGSENEADIIANELAGPSGRSKDGSRFLFLLSRPRGVKFSEFSEYRDPDTLRELTTSDDQYSIETMLRRLSKKLEKHHYEIFVSVPRNLIRLDKITGQQKTEQ